MTEKKRKVEVDQTLTDHATEKVDRQSLPDNVEELVRSEDPEHPVGIKDILSLWQYFLPLHFSHTT